MRESSKQNFCAYIIIEGEVLYSKTINKPKQI